MGCNHKWHKEKGGGFIFKILHLQHRSTYSKLPGYSCGENGNVWTTGRDIESTAHVLMLSTPDI